MVTGLAPDVESWASPTKLQPETAVAPLEGLPKNALTATARVMNMATHKSLATDVAALAEFLHGNKNPTTKYRHYLETAKLPSLFLAKKFDSAYTKIINLHFGHWV